MAGANQGTRTTWPMKAVRVADDDVILEVGAEKSRQAGEVGPDEIADEDSTSGAAGRRTLSSQLELQPGLQDEAPRTGCSPANQWYFAIYASSVRPWLFSSVTADVVFTKWQTMLLAYRSLGIVYGDLGTSPLYVFSSLVLPDAGEADFLGVLSLILWTLTAMSLVIRQVRAHRPPRRRPRRRRHVRALHVSFKSDTPVPVARQASGPSSLGSHGERRSGPPSRLHRWLEGSSVMQAAVTCFVLLGTCMMIGDGALTPAISVLSAVQGTQSRSSNIKQEHVVILSVVILLLLFLVQRFGTNKVSASCSPIMLAWFGSIAMIGVYNIAKHYPPVLKAVSRHYIYYYFARNKKVGWEQLGAIILRIKGAEAMFADLGHFNKSSIQVAFSTLVYPSLILAYSGQAAYLIKHPSQLSTTFYSSIPEHNVLILAAE
ncbi:potassium transporter 6-like [Panicum miliaceum]|uniref:Potassium transporter 6-like n=1 Tax=Panicum miliaceum TaxID=4540 RepID=A0A3L6SQM2_PANMI|nr:potassium transporter 6-like [Panicum miliaceum]